MIKKLSGAGILADKAIGDHSPDFARFNLIYGFNGSGKSTLSRIFACLEGGKQHEALPEECSFDIELDDGTSLSSQKELTGLENRICVFNADFIEQNLQWGTGRANSIFYISQEQAELAAELKATQAKFAAGVTARAAQNALVTATDRAVRSYRTERARLVSSDLHLGNRRYEANHLQSDYDTLSYGPESVLADDALKALVAIARQTAPPPPLVEIKINVPAMHSAVESARYFGEAGIGQVMLEELDRHPSMVPWINKGHEYHESNGLATCLLCGNTLTEDRKLKLAAALDDGIALLLKNLETERTQTAELLEAARGLSVQWPKTRELDLPIQADYAAAIKAVTDSLGSMQTELEEAQRVIEARLAWPTTVVPHKLLPAAALKDICDNLIDLKVKINALISTHNITIVEFTKRQNDAREAIRRHYLAEGSAQYKDLNLKHKLAETEFDKINRDNDDLQRRIHELNTMVKSHGPAAEHISRLMRAYLGHGELSIVTADKGYELHRHGRLVKGQPSEGEKTAIALCYFLSTLESEGRSVQDLIIVIDDPISSLDTKAMNYACTLVRNRLRDAAQLFILTHNLHCMNEFKKAWRNWSKAEDGKPAKATLLFIDVKMTANTGRRTSQIIEMPAQLRGYDSEYHFLCHKMLQFEAAGEVDFEYSFMMPNVIRRVLEIFLAFKVPGSHSILQKLDSLTTKLRDFDKTRIFAIERLMQVESHSDNLEDLVAHSSMTVEETRDANAAMLALMEAADEDHTRAIRSQCKAA